jgi:hypothetical protein
MSVAAALASLGRHPSGEVLAATLKADAEFAAAWERLALVCAVAARLIAYRS